MPPRASVAEYGIAVYTTTAVRRGVSMRSHVRRV